MRLDVEEHDKTHEIVFFSVVFASGRARLSTFSRSFVLARILVCRYACKQEKGGKGQNMTFDPTLTPLPLSFTVEW